MEPAECRGFQNKPVNAEPAFGRPVLLAHVARFPPVRRKTRRRSHQQPARQRESVVMQLAGDPAAHRTRHSPPPIRRQEPPPRKKCSLCSPVIPGPVPRFPSLRHGRSRSQPRRRLRDDGIPHRFAGFKDIPSSRPPRSRGFQFPEDRGMLTPNPTCLRTGPLPQPCSSSGSPNRVAGCPGPSVCSHRPRQPWPAAGRCTRHRREYAACPSPVAATDGPSRLGPAAVPRPARWTLAPPRPLDGAAAVGRPVGRPIRLDSSAPRPAPCLARRRAVAAYPRSA